MKNFKAFAVTCDKYFPGKKVHYAALSKQGAINEALMAMYKVGGRADRDDLNAEHVPEYDKLAGVMPRSGCLDLEIKQR